MTEGRVSSPQEDQGSTVQAHAQTWTSILRLRPFVAYAAYLQCADILLATIPLPEKTIQTVPRPMESKMIVLAELTLSVVRALLVDPLSCWGLTSKHDVDSQLLARVRTHTDTLVND